MDKFGGHTNWHIPGELHIASREPGQFKKNTQYTGQQINILEDHCTTGSIFPLVGVIHQGNSFKEFTNHHWRKQAFADSTNIQKVTNCHATPKLGKR